MIVIIAKINVKKIRNLTVFILINFTVAFESIPSPK
jgi:hypothetical protein